MLELTDDSKAKLASLKTQPGYLVLLREVMGGLCRAANDELLQLDPAKPENSPQTIALMQAATRAKYSFVNKVETEVDFLVREFMDASAEPEETAEVVDEDEANALPPRGRLPMEIR